LLLCLVCLLATAVGSAAVVGSLRLSRTSTMVTGFWVVLAGQLASETLLVGGVFRRLDPTVLAATALAAAGAEVGGCYFWARSAARDAALQVVSVAGYGIRRMRRHPALLILGLLVVAQYGWQIVLAVRLPQVSFDGLAYHLIGPDTWIQHHAIVHSRQNLLSDVFPADQELLTAWTGTFLHTMRYAGLSTLPFVAMAASAVTMLARNLKVRTSLALLGGLGVVAMPAVFLQASTAYVDIASGATALAALGFLLIVASSVTFVRGTARGLAGHLLLAGTAAGLAAGTKSTNLVVAAAVVVIGFVQFVRITDIRPDLPERTVRPRGRVGAACLLVPLATLSAFWYVRTWVTWKNPFYPFDVLGFPGRGTTSSIIGASEPATLRHAPLGLLGATIKSWLYDLHRHAYIYDQRLGGFGLQWPLLVAPALLLAIVWFARRRLDYLFGLLVPVVVVAIATSAPWWARFTIALAGAGCVCLALCLERIARLVDERRTVLGQLRLSRYAPTVLTALFVATTGLSMWWATNPTNYALLVHDHLKTASLADVRHVMTLPHPESVLYPLFAYTDLDKVLPVGSSLAIVADNQVFTHPLVGEDLQRRLVAVGSPDTADQLAAALTRSGTTFVLLRPTTTATGLVKSVDAQPTRFLPLTSGGQINGGDIYQLGTWPVCHDPSLAIVASSLSTTGSFMVTARLSDSCGIVAKASVNLFQGDKGTPIYLGSDKVIDSRTTAADGTVTFTVASSPPSARYFLRVEGQRIGRAFHSATASSVITPVGGSAATASAP
jgi:hypothetical protein